MVARGRGHKHDCLAVGSPDGGQFLAGLAFRAAETGLGRELGAGKQVARLGAGARVLHEEVRLALVEPVVPVVDRETLVHVRVVLAVLRRLRGLLVGVVIRRAGIDFAHEEQLLPVGTPLRRAGARLIYW